MTYEQETGSTPEMTQDPGPDPAAGVPGQPAPEPGQRAGVPKALVLALAAAGVAALAVAAFLVLGGGSGGEELTMDEYFSRVDTVFEAADKDTTGLEDAFDADVAEAASFDEEIDLLLEFLTGTIGVFEAALADMEAISPPGEANDAHDEFVAAASDAMASTEQLVDKLEKAESQADADDILTEFERDAESTLSRADEACFDLQALADENAVDVDLDCEE